MVQFSELELSSDAMILLARQAEAQVQVCQELAEGIAKWQEPSALRPDLQNRLWAIADCRSGVIDQPTHHYSF